MYGHKYSKSTDQPGKVASPVRGQLNRKMNISPSACSCLRIWARETGSAVPSRASLLISILRLNLVLSYGVHPELRAAASIYSFITTIRHRVSPEFIGSRNCVPMAFTAESPAARGQ